MTKNLNNIQLQRGDIFCSRNPMSLGRVINFVQALYARDRDAKYSHAGIILDDKGTTLEAIWTVREQNIFEAYAGQDILIGRPITLKENDICYGIDTILQDHCGQVYPFLRIFLFLIPPLVRRLPWIKGVCSELTCKYLNKAGLSDIVWLGKVPDDIDEMITYHKDFRVIYSGKLPEVK